MSRIGELKQEEKELTRITDISWKGAIVSGLLASCFTILSLWGLQQRNKVADYVGKGGVAVFTAISVTGMFSFFRYGIELEEVKARIESRQSIPPACRSCSYFSNNLLLPCAVKPDLEENCRDWEGR